jgi:serine/threonine protein kinase
MACFTCFLSLNTHILSSLHLLLQGVGLLPDFNKVNFPKMAPIPLSVVIPSARSDDLAFIDQILQLDPKKRLSSSDVCVHPYFIQQIPRPALSIDLQVPVRPTKPVKTSRPIQSLEEMIERAKKLANQSL